MKYFDNEIYHIYNRGVHQSPIFFNTDNYLYCINLMNKYASKYFVDILGYCLMPNHYHLVVQQKKDGSISKFIQTTFNAYAQAVNKQQRLSGALFQGKAKSKQIDSDNYVLQVIRYIHLNPVTAKLVGKPEDWEFSNYLTWIGAQTDHLKGLQFRERYFEKPEDYRFFVESYNEENDKRLIGKYFFEE